MDIPTFVRIDYWNSTKQDWEVGHNGTNLINPAKYVAKLAARGKIARAVNKETGEAVYSDGGDLL